MKEQVKINKEKCIGCGACNSIAPKNFGWDETTAKVINEEVTEDAKVAVESCPTGAITIEEKE